MSTKSLVVYITLGCCFAFSQNSPYTFLNGTRQTPLDAKQRVNKSIINTKPGEIVSVQTLKDGTSKVTKIDLTEMVDLIVEMKDKPLFIQQHETSGTVLQKPAYMNRFMQFRSDIVTLHQSSVKSLKTTLAASMIRREFYKIFVGVAVRVPRAMISQIASLNYVKKVHVDVRVKALLDHSMHQIHADSVWTKLGIQGDSVVVGILDTGIDYLNTALGGGFGPAFKVIGGYDFINTDADPMDDHGHGTHVAGIVAANSDSLKGVAPHAKLMAFKVLDKDGWGSESQVLAGIERVTDPNDDGNFSDMVDVVNVSLGGSGSPNDALSTAVDNAVKLGITFCIAAGNSYNFYTIGSPGTARLAITVGAVDKNDVIASFSSKGPNSVIYSIKPEVVAPGVNILSTLPGNNTGQMRGTSMATPHVTGVCALLKSLHRNWSPAQIKSAVMTTALDLGQEAMAQGAGRIEALKSAEVSTFVVPSQLSFGLADFTPIWTRADTVWVTNRSLQSQSFTISFDNLGSGILITANPSTFSLTQNDSQQVIMNLLVDNSLVPYPHEGSLSYSGKAHICGTKDTLHIPWAFVKAAKVTIAFDQPYANFVLANQTYVILSFEATWSDSTHAEFIVPEGTYDLFSFFWGSSIQSVLQEGLSISNVASLSVSSTDAKYSVALQGVDQKGQPLSSCQSLNRAFLFAFPDSSRFGGWSITGSIDSMLVSGFSSRFKLICGESAFQPPNSIYSINYDLLEGLQGNRSLVNRVSEFYTQNLRAKFPPSPQYQKIDYVTWTKFVSNDYWFYFGVLSGLDIGFTGEWNGKLFLNSEQDTHHSFPISLVAYDWPQLNSDQGIWFLSAPFMVVNDSIGMFFGPRPPASLYLSSDDGTVALGRAPIYTDAAHYNNIYGSSNIAASPYFYGALDEEKHTSVYRSHYSIYDKDDNVIASDTLINMIPLDVPAGEYRFEVKHQDYYVRDVQGLATLTTRFDLRKADANPPEITSMRLLNSKGLSVDSISVGELATFVFSSVDIDYIQNEYGSYIPKYKPINADSTKLFYRKNGFVEWNSLPVTLWMADTANINPRGLAFNADMTDATRFDSTGIDLKLVLQDQSGNTTEWSLEPAFGIGRFSRPVSVEEKENNPSSIHRTFALRQNYPNPFNPSTTIEFDIPHTSFVTLEIFNLLGQKVVTVLAENLKAGTYRIPWNANNLSSGVYFYRLNAGTFVDTKKFLLLK
jgi:hypothetical protein